MSRIPVVTLHSGIVDVANLKESDINIYDIAHSLANQCRYNGYTAQFYSVAEHSCILAEYALRIYAGQEHRYNMARALLLHDATEAYIGDVTHHLKQALPGFMKLESKIMEVILEKYGILDFYNEHEKTISMLDKGICIDEMKAMKIPIDPWLSSYRALNVPVVGLLPRDAKVRFMALANHLKIKENVH